MENRDTPPRIYISLTATSATNRETDFSFIARQLKAARLDVIFECIRLRPGETLWDHVCPWVTSNDIAGWAYVLSMSVLNDRGRKDELASPLDRAIEERGAGFPLVGLLYHGIPAQSLPLQFRLRPYIHLADPDWEERLAAIVTRNTAEQDSEFIWRIHREYGGDSSKTAIEVSPRSDVVSCWRFAVPKSVRPVDWGHGVPGGGEIAAVRFSAIRGAGRLENTEITWFGCEDALSQNESAYVVFDGQLPDFVCFGRARTPASAPGKMEIYRCGGLRRGRRLGRPNPHDKIEL